MFTWRNFFFLVLLHSVFTGYVAAKVIPVRPGNNVQALIDRAKAGDTLLISKGYYKQHSLVVKKKLTLIGRDYPVFDGLGKYEVLFIYADSVVVKGLQVQNIGKSSMNDLAGIKVSDHRDVVITGNRIINGTYGIYLQNSKFCVVKGNYIQSNATDELSSGNGIHAWKSTDLLILDNIISGHRDGIYFEFVSNSTIRNNRSFRNVRYGLHFMFSNNDRYEYNKFSENGAGVAVMYSKVVTMVGNIFIHNWGDASYGLLLKDISDSRISNNRFLKNTVGIYMEGTSRIEVNQNTFEENGWALRVQANSSGSNFHRNNFVGNSFDVATNGTLMLNYFSNNYWDKYDGYDLDKDGTGDVPYYPVSAYSVITEQVPVAMILYRSFLSGLIEMVEKILPTLIPDQMKDDRPLIKRINLHDRNTPVN
ncbi:nitrous oxide reductase family maturation protein NosD [Pararcticibacter amylolyticus]|uniref:Nitrous oxide reductase family maturation protein NosD n=2 Tax=Pararcticibacter amylolyticus TaxID=2173175 RepID=A0A2U2PJ03_9SPHI|nr:nitrous oxide reductase family maturation protein NosD [Pararcticibacter amylolyticus]